MKKILLVAVLLFNLIVLFGCKDKSPNYGSYTFEDKTVQTSQEIQDQLDVYIERVKQIRLKNRTEGSNNDQSSKVFQRDDLPDSYPYPSEHSIIAQLGVIEVALTRYKIIIESYEAFQENTYATINNIDDEFKIKIKIENNQMFIETYEYRIVAEDEDKSVNARLIYLNLVDDKLYFEFLRDDQSTYIPVYTYPSSFGNRTYYDMFIEDGDCVSLYFDKNNKEDYYYESYSLENQLNFNLYVKNSNLYMRFTDHKISKGYTLNIDLSNEEINPTSLKIDYFSDIEGFSWVNEVENSYYDLSWNLMEVDGWTTLHAETNEWFTDYKVFINDQEVSDLFRISAYVDEYTYLNAGLRVDKDEMSENIINLSIYDLYYDQISYEELIADIDYLNENYLTILNNQGFEIDHIKNTDYLLDMLSFKADQDIIDELFIILESE